MKQRRTYLVSDPDSFTPEQLEVKDGSLSLKGLHAVEEHRITFSLDELPTKLRSTLKQWQELHIKWASLKPYTAIPPFTSRVSPGLHVSFEPHKSQSKGQLCKLLHTAFDPEAKCSSGTDAGEAATPLLHASTDENEKPDVSLQYYSYLPALNQFVSFIEKTLCPPSSATCPEYATSLLNASYLDIDYSHPTSTLLLTAFFDIPPNGRTTLIPAPPPGHTTEVGVLTHEPNPDPEDLAFAGFLTVLGADAAPKPTRFQTPARHYPLSPADLKYTTRFAHPTGLHPTLELSFPPSQLTPPDESCTLNAHLTLPSTLFIDKYQFTDPLFLRAQNLVALRHVAGATDLEAPDWVVSQWGSAALLELAVPEASQNAKAHAEWTARIPLHLRYLPASPGGHTAVPVPWPVVFWACDAVQDTAGNPFDRVNLGYEGAFGQGTRFMHVPPRESGNGTGELVSWIDVPVLDTSAAGWVEAGTIGVVVCAFLGLCWVLFSGGEKKDTKMEKKKQ